MMKIWDFFMRRKPLFVALFAIFLLSGWLSSVFLRITAPIVPDNASSLIVKQNNEANSQALENQANEMLSLKIANPTGVEAIIDRYRREASEAKTQETPEKPQNVNETESTVSQADEETDLEVPLTSTPEVASPLVRWQAIVFQTSAALFVGAAACILAALARRFFTRGRN